MNTNDSTGTQALHGQLVLDMQRWLPEPGVIDAGFGGLTLIRQDATRSSCTPTVYEPSLGIIIQGQKKLTVGDREIVYGPLSYLALSVHLPLLGQVVGASPEQPYLGIKLSIDPAEIGELVLAMGEQAPESEPGDACPEGACSLCKAEMDADMLAAVVRLVGLKDRPRDVPVIAPIARREVLYRALGGEMGARLRRFAVVDSQAHRISRVIAVLKNRYTEPLRISELANAANMSESSLFHSFKQVTRMSPLQFQKRLRLHEARRLMISEGIEAASASFRVGYESPSHFSREYSRMFGAPPRADVSKVRGVQAVGE